MRTLREALAQYFAKMEELLKRQEVAAETRRV
jgi:hypothetical protein